MVVSDALTFYLISTISSLIVVFLGVIYKSKCKVVTCCGCVRIERDVDAEERIDEMELGKSKGIQLQPPDIIHDIIQHDIQQLHH
jgi:hypothetical protein